MSVNEVCLPARSAKYKMCVFNNKMQMLFLYRKLTLVDAAADAAGDAEGSAARVGLTISVAAVDVCENCM